MQGSSTSTLATRAVGRFTAGRGTAGSTRLLWRAGPHGGWSRVGMQRGGAAAAAGPHGGWTAAAAGPHGGW